MALGRRKGENQEELFVMHSRLPKSPGHVFYRKLNQLLAEAGFDRWVETLCEPFYANGKGRPSLPPGVYFRMLLVGYFEGINSQRGIAWRCSDSLSLREFLGVPLGEDSPDHSSLSYIRERLPIEVHEQVFVWILSLAREKKLLKGQTVAVDSTTLEANAAMKSIVRRETGEDWREYVTRLMREAGEISADETPSEEALRRFDKKRKNKRVSNKEWESPTDPDSCVARMKDGTTHLAYKAEHVVDLDTEVILAAEVYYATESDKATLEDSVVQAQINQHEAGSENQIQDVVADCGYHSNQTIATMAEHSTTRTYIPEPRNQHGQRKWTDKPAAQKASVYANRRRTRGKRGRNLQRLRSERVERTFAHVCETGGARRTWLRGIDKVQKRYLMSAAAHNLGLVMRSLFGIGTPRGLQQYNEDLRGLVLSLYFTCLAIWRPIACPQKMPMRMCRHQAQINRHNSIRVRHLEVAVFSTGC
jgi:transposase